MDTNKLEANSDVIKDLLQLIIQNIKINKNLPDRIFKKRKPD